MRKQHFARLELERLEELALPNMLSPFLFLNEAASGSPSLIAAQNTDQSHMQAHVPNSTIVDSSQPRLSFLRPDAPAHFDAQSGTSKPSTQNTSFALATDDLTDSLNTDSFAIDLLASSKARGPSFVGRDSSRVFTPSGAAANTSVSNTVPISAAGNQRFSGGGTATSSGSSSLPNNPAASATLLLSPGQSVAGVPAGQEPLGGGPSGIISSFAAGPNVATGTVVVTAPTDIPVNADNDNGSAIVNNFPGIPTKRDFNVAPLPVNDSELLQGSVKLVGVPGGGVWTLSITSTGSSKVALWIDQKKSAPFTAANAPGTFYVEGVHESTSGSDWSRITFTHTLKGTLWGGEADVQVTPIVQSLAVSPAGGNAGDNIFFINGVDATQGLGAGIPPATPGATFKGSVTYTNLNGKPVFLQNVTALYNGGNGTHLPNGHSVGYLYAPGSNPAGANLVLKQGLSFPILDSDPANAPEYSLHPKTLQMDGNTYTIQDDDSPSAGLNPPAPGPQAGVTLDQSIYFTLWLLWKYPSGIYYPLAYTTWSVTWYADANAQNPNGPVNNIIIRNGVFAPKVIS